MTIAKQIYEIVKSLPEDQASKILTFVKFIRAKHLNANQTVTTVDSTSWSELTSALAGTWQEDFPSLEEIRSE
jgi:hypothetical protein